MSWTYKKKTIGELTDFPKNVIGFVYMVTHKPTGKSYIGKKVLFHSKKKKLTKRELSLYEGVVGRKPTYKIETKESDWKSYYGSQSQIKLLLKEGSKEDLADTIEAKESFILDGTAASVNQTIQLKSELEEAGYEVFMLYVYTCLLYTSPSPRDRQKSRMPSSA